MSQDKKFRFHGSTYEVGSDGTEKRIVTGAAVASINPDAAEASASVVVDEFGVANFSFGLLRGEKGAAAYVYYTCEDGRLIANIPDENTGVNFSITDDGHMEVVFE